MPYVILGGAQLAVGAAAIFARYALGGAGPVAVSAGRLAIAAAVLLALAAVRRTKTRVGARDGWLLAAAGVALAAHFVTWIWSLEYTSVALSTLLVTTTPVWTALYDASTGVRTLSRRAVIAFLTGGAGLVMVVAWDRTAAPVAGHELLGSLLALAGSVAIAAYLLVVRDVRRRVPDTRAIVTRTYGWSALALLVLCAAVREPLPAPSNYAAWGGIAAMALVSQLLGHTALNASLRWFTPSAVSFATLLEPVFAAVLAVIVFAEPVPPLAIVGGVVLLASIAVVLREERLEDWTAPNHQLE